MARQLTEEDVKNMSPEQVQDLIKQQCIFCRIISGEIPAKKVYEDSNVLAVLDINPANPGHILVVPKKHYQILPQMPDEESAYLLNICKKLSSVLFEALGAHGTNILQRNGPAAGQEVPHVHVHVIPRFEEDKVGLLWKPVKLEEAMFNEIQKKISEKAKGISADKKKAPVYDESGKEIKEEKSGDKKEEKPAQKVYKIKPRRP